MKKILKWLGIGVFVIIAIAVIASMGKSGNKPTTSSSSSDQKQVEQVKVAEKVTATLLANDFDANQVAAENKWKGKLVEFSAEITNITDSGLSFSKIGSKEISLTQISCRVVDKQQLLSLKNGQTVTVRGTVGSQTFGVIDVNDCKVI